MNRSQRRAERNIQARLDGDRKATEKRLGASLRANSTRITAAQISAILAPIQTALIAFRMGTAGTIHYHDLAAGLSVCFFTAQRVARHRHLLPDIQAALDAMNAVFQRTAGTDEYRATPDELRAVELASDVYRGVLTATSWSYVRKAISDAMPTSA